MMSTFVYPPDADARVAGDQSIPCRSGRIAGSGRGSSKPGATVRLVASMSVAASHGGGVGEVGGSGPGTTRSMTSPVFQTLMLRRVMLTVYLPRRSSRSGIWSRSGSAEVEHLA